MHALTPAELVTPILERVHGLVKAGVGTVFVGLDGRSGSGKSTLARVVADLLAEQGLSVTVIEGDEFYGGGSAATWDARPPLEKVDGVIDWRRQRDVLQKLRDQGRAEWAPFDWDSEDWDSDNVTLSSDMVCAGGAAVVMLEGAYSCRPELSDLMHLRVLLEVPNEIRRRRLLEREPAEYRAEWAARWSDAEAHYFGDVVPPGSFDLVVGQWGQPLDPVSEYVVEDLGP